MSKRKYVIDTSVFLTDHNSIIKFGSHDIIIPLKVLEEIDKHKKRQDSVVAFSNQKTLEEIIKRASDGKQRVAKMMKRDLGIEKTTLVSESKKINGSKSVKLFNRCLDDVL